MSAHLKGCTPPPLGLILGMGMLLGGTATAAVLPQQADDAGALETVIVTATRTSQDGDTLPSAWVALNEETITLSLIHI